ncbi:TIGR01777 family oxidoreductase [Poseidonibacter ostreae]|uniref:TIGR01777 family protein n=1 Tax=Poseidonibacter ostreae TaxID=2654171 RepID=A0A6L4WQG1_9BACT|nr:TIGR01777 family oxidoreductase [Poseidonibacter ostreae]KAB7886746.1 TIGR01777 family protein [Poseidonibacter ostreae]MAC83194.1 TIGR01777 family protein [Arcobacter sp.]|tara:strand:+ start:17424 stop:18281 length:858 start_codon:yes stop_codon:yes gene_type:complete
MKTLTITGSSGFVGTNLRKLFENNGFNVIGIKRDELKDDKKLLTIIETSDIIINLAGANIISRWTESYKKTLYNSRLDTTKALVSAMQKAEKKPELFISTSAVGIYKNSTCYDEEYYEYEDDFLANLCKDWENEALKAKELGIRTAIFRFGIVLGKGGGALDKMLTPFKLGLGGTIGYGLQSFSFIHLEDLLNAYSFVYENKDLEGVFNLTAPEPSTNYDFTKALGKSLNRPTILPIPEFVLNIIFSEGAKVLTDGQCVKPKKLLDNGFEFEFEDIKSCVDDLVK